jgi:VIT1/CCC1 family predicted Fe2+/Mn2+ transporter
MSSYLPAWLTDIGTLSSIISLIVSGFLLYEARKIRDSFLRRARLPEVIKELSTVNNQISKSLKDWETEEKEGINQFTIAYELLDNLISKLPDNEKQKVLTYMPKLKVKKLLFFSSVITTADSNKAWELYSGLSGIITALKQLQKDSKWD